MGIWNRLILVWCLTPLAVLFRGVVSIRNFLFDRGVLRSSGVSVPVISVGNITVGGTGKTPLVAFLVRILRDAGASPAVVSRGYGRTGKTMVVVSDGKRILVPVRRSGDEPYLLARALPGAAMIVDRRRLRGACHAVEAFRSNVIVLDDGFQHRSIRRDLDVVVFDAGLDLRRLSGMLPAGPFREPLASLKRAHWVVLTGMDRCPDPEGLIGRIRSKTGAGICTARHKPEMWIRLSDGSPSPPEAMASVPVLGFSGIGNTDGFLRTLEDLGVRPAGFRRFQDHHWYSREDLESLDREARNLRVKALVTTEKDAVRLPQDGPSGVLVYFLRISLDIVFGAEDLTGRVKALVRT